MRLTAPRILSPRRLRLAAALVGAQAGLSAAGAAAATLDIDVLHKYGAVSLAALDSAIADARRHFADQPDDTVVLHLPAGAYSLSDQDGGPGSIDVSNVRPGPNGGLLIQGAGRDRTTLVFDTHRDEIIGRNTYRVAFAGLHFTVGYLTVSQGHVVSISPGAIVLRIEHGLPSPEDLVNPDSDRGRYLRRCTDSDSAPEIDPGGSNVQVAWRQARHLSGDDWRLDLKSPLAGAGFRMGDLIAIKSKHADGNAYRFIHGAEVTFKDVLWTRLTRGVFRGVDHVKILNAAIERDPAVDGHVPCLASAAGGPQIGQPRDPPTTGDVVENFTAVGTGDDAIAFFNASGAIRNATISDSFARGILLFHSPDVELGNIHLQRAPMLRN